MNTGQPRSLSPELEFELFKLVLLREKYVKKLETRLAASRGYIDLDLVGVFDVLRDATLQVVETTRQWERAQVRHGL